VIGWTAQLVGFAIGGTALLFGILRLIAEVGNPDVLRLFPPVAVTYVAICLLVATLRRQRAKDGAKK